jgi:hypothetical protein
MMKINKTISFKSFLYFLLVFLSGAITSSIFEWLQPIATIEVRNASGKVIRHMDIDYRGMGDHKGRIAENLEPGQKATFKWITEGEGSYQLRVTFEDGTEVRGGAGYIERGDLIKESVESARVISQVPVWFTFGKMYHPAT